LIGNLRRTALFLLLLGRAACSSVAANAQNLVLAGGSVYKSPDATPLSDAVVVTSNGVITAIRQPYGGEVQTQKMRALSIAPERSSSPVSGTVTSISHGA